VRRISDRSLGPGYSQDEPSGPLHAADWSVVSRGMRGLAPALVMAGVMLLSWTYPGALALLAGASQSVAGLAALALLGWSLICVLLIRAVHAGVSS
jgi:hypothetical protein